MDFKPSRREFVATSFAGIAGVAFGRGAQEQDIVLGSGAHKYKWVPDWLTPPSHIKYGDTHGLAQDSTGKIYLSHTVHPTSESSDGVCVFDEQGKFLESWGPQFKGGSHGLDVRKEGEEEFIYHCDTNRRKVCKTTLKGETIWERGEPKEAGVYDEKHAYIPTNVAFGPEGDLFVADGYGSSYIHIYDKNGEYKKTFGGPGSDKGKVQQPHGIWLDNRDEGDPTLAVADRANRRIQYFSLEGEHIGFVTNGMRLPCHFSIRNGEMLVPDLQSIVTILDPYNSVIAQIGDGDPTNLRDHPRADFVPGKFIHPHDAIFLRNGDILVAEWVPIGRVTLLRKIK